MKLLMIHSEKAAPYYKKLIKAGFVMESAGSLGEAEEHVQEYFYDAIIADIVRMCEGGYRLIARVREVTPRTGIVIVSSEDAREVKLRALMEGADEYLVKPVDTEELLARVFSIIRRSTMGGRRVIECQGVRIDPSAHRVTCTGKTVILTRKEYELLLFLIRNPERVMTHEMIAEYLWGDFKSLSADCFDFIYSHVKNLHRKLSRAGSRLVIDTVYGVGYVVK